MAEKRMFTQKIIDSDSFLDMPLSTQALYFHLNMRADDDGFINNPKRICRTVGASDDDLRLLMGKRFVICFETGVIVIKHWRMHNTLKSDRYRPTQYQEEFAQLEVKPNKAYTERLPEPEQNRNGAALAPQNRIEQNRIAEGKIEETAAADTAEQTRPPRRKYGQYGWVRLTEEEYGRLLHDFGEDEVKRCIAYVDESAQSTGNKNKWKDWNLVVRKCKRDGWGKKETPTSAKSVQRNAGTIGAHTACAADLEAMEKLRNKMRGGG